MNQLEPGGSGLVRGAHPVAVPCGQSWRTLGMFLIYGPGGPGGNTETALQADLTTSPNVTAVATAPRQLAQKHRSAG
jgi:hypothetical protein